MNEKTITCHAFKWKNFNTCAILIIFLCNLTPFLACECTPSFLPFTKFNELDVPCFMHHPFINVIPFPIQSFVPCHLA